MKVWHYTIRQRLDSILSDGELRPATAMVPAHERPVLWFSANQSFEPTARKLIARLGGDGMLDVLDAHRLSEDETEQVGGGLLRFGIDAADALPWRRKLVRAANIRRAEWESLEAVALDSGADPSQWYGVIGALPLAKIQSVEERVLREWQTLDVKR